MINASGECSNCHTMHNSQDNASMEAGANAPGVGQTGECVQCHGRPWGELLRSDCLGCHAMSVGGGPNIVNRIPQVAHTGTDLAAGNYRYMIIAADPDTYGHNVHGFRTAGIVEDDDMPPLLINVPPGYTAAFDPSSGKYQPAYHMAAQQIMCAGRNGCHGDRDQVGQMDAMRGTHHADDRAVKFGTTNEAGMATSVGNSYRFLRGVKGIEDDDWQASANSTTHNEYKGVAFADRSALIGQTWADITSISQFCAECHGLFHQSGGSGIGSPSTVWLRHPNDVELPNAAPYTNYATYDPTVPIGRQSLDPLIGGASAAVNHGSDVIMCITCHRPHASPYPDMLRWDYTETIVGTTDPAGQGLGCFVCHTEFDG